MDNYLLDIGFVSRPFPSRNLVTSPIFCEPMVLVSDRRYSSYPDIIKVESLSVEEQNRHPYVIRNGASTALGSLGYVQAVVELCEQCAGRGIEIKHLFVPGGNGGLAAGVIFGTALVEAPFHVHVVTVEHEKQELQEILCGFIRDLQELTGSLAGASFDDLYTIHEEYRGEGWGIPTPESVDWIHDLARTEGIFVEKVYTSKTLYGMLDLIQKGSIDGSACYLHSGGFGALFSQFETL